MTIFERKVVIPVPREQLSQWHMRDGAFERLCPPWQEMRPISADPMANGAKRIVEVKKGGIWMRWVAHHCDVKPGESFTDVQMAGPFKSWKHVHRFEALDADSSRLVDHIEYTMPLGALGKAVAGASIHSDLDRMFVYRHRVTLGDLTHHARYFSAGPKRIVVSGASGLIGRQLVGFLRTAGHHVLRLVRRSDEPADDEIRWSLDSGVRDVERLEGVDVVVHLAGASVARRWTDATRREILDSRVRGTRVLVDALQGLRSKPSLFIGASAVGYYGDTGAEVVDESAPLGEGFLAEVCQQWEAETERAQALGCRTAQLRIGVVVDPRGGALAKMLPLFRMGLGGRLGSGQQLMSWVGLDDVLGAVALVMSDPSVSGAINVTGPQPVSQSEFADTLGRVLSRPSFAPAPAAAVSLLYGEMGVATALASTGAQPSRLLAHDYEFRAPTLELALQHALGCGAPSVSC